jgi:Transglycosylase SLT domain
MNLPTKTLLASAACLLVSIPALSQEGPRYALDNFDTRKGVQVIEPPPVVSPGKGKGKVQLTAKSGSSAHATAAVDVYHAAPSSRSATALLDGFTTGNAEIDGYIAESGNRYNVDPVLLYSIMHQESTFKRFAVSPKGARGLMQLMPATAARFGVTNIFDPRQNIDAGAKYVRFLLNMFDENVPLTLAGYNAGEGAVLKYGRQVPPYRETQEYVRRDPSVALNARRIRGNEVAAVRGEKKLPLSLYERNVFAVKLPDGRLQLVSQ